MNTLRFSALIGVVYCSASSFAAIVGTGGASTLISAPPNATLNVLTSLTQAFAWNESQNFTLTQNITVDAFAPGLYDQISDLGSFVIPLGQRVNSHYLHFDVPAGASGTITGSLTFDSAIIGVIVQGDAPGLQRLDDSDFLSSGTIYDNGLAARGMEISPNTDLFAISGSGLTLNYNMKVGEPGDRVRIITEAAVPEPATIGCFALGSLLFSSRRKLRA